MRRTPVALVLAFSASSCAAPQANRVCDSIFFVQVNCRPAGPLIASTSNTLPTQSTPAKAPVVSERAQMAPIATDPAPTQPAAPVAPLPEVPAMNAVYFDVGKDELTPGSKLTLRRIADFLKEAKGDAIQLAAYTDPSGSAAKNSATCSRLHPGLRTCSVCRPRCTSCCATDTSDCVGGPGGVMTTTRNDMRRGRR